MDGQFPTSDRPDMSDQRPATVHDSAGARQVRRQVRSPLPVAYCPNDNKIERLWKALHDNVTRNHRCPTLEALMDEVEAWLDRPPDERTGAGLRSAKRQDRFVKRQGCGLGFAHVESES